VLVVDGAIVVGREVVTLGVVGASELGPGFPGVEGWQPATSVLAASTHTKACRAVIADKTTQPVWPGPEGAPARSCQ
jgi:hypothetical protein